MTNDPILKRNNWLQKNNDERLEREEEAYDDQINAMLVDRGYSDVSGLWDR